eukprot:CAMPEP_0113569912 /NCGR_PEP_ID=MMETSP0015_2-20120614/24674_1 /TAXON_ID=2838 /ORGANISM="Odontella" /LENGTH=400 /DNA_ID=CAMNT_0000472629 /DNA_START=172 /DNA_END=1374 /DNA_ORIENTATION=- /assembly_acc=CAM_ASM_000160
MTFFQRSGARFMVTSKEKMDLHERLPVGTYTVGLDECSGQFYVEQIEKFEAPGKLYGSTNRQADRILRTFMDRSNSTGVLLAGEKGSGKTLLAKVISIKAAQDGVPTIVINKSWHGEEFNGFLQKIEQPTVVVFDEFEKVYDDTDKQEAMLTLLDGVYPSKKLFLLTCNDKSRVDSNMQNRPGRIFYMLDFSGLENEFIKEYCEDNLIAKDHIPAVVAVSSLFSAFNFDMLKGMVEDMNRYDESPAQVLQFLNIRPDFDNAYARYAVDLKIEGMKKEDFIDIDKTWHGNPIKNEVRISYSYQKKGDNDEEEDECCKDAKFNMRHVKKLDAHADTYIFANGEGARLTLTPAKAKFSLNPNTMSAMGLKDAFMSNKPGDEEIRVEESAMCFFGDMVDDMSDY